MTTVFPRNPDPGPAGAPATRPEGFDEEVCELVLDTAPQLFAVVEEFATVDGDLDACVAAWGLAHEDGTAHVTRWDGRSHMIVNSPRRAAEVLAARSGSRAYLVWVPPEPGPD
ncbi:hypothetical protein GCM10009716_25850 [Streptomyces sodiiphilus]|uniref:Uncharacterized protein n=1 Tax=Streptomyces sodiiphilus TaxID=226217 RepID=A0ABN2PAD5_9ACTN